MPGSRESGTRRSTPRRQPSLLLIGAYLRALREAHGLKAAAVARHLRADVSSLLLWERGSAGLLKGGRLQSLLRAYAASGMDVSNALLRLLPSGSARWPDDTFCDNGAGNGDRASAALHAATAVRVYSMNRVPEPFQTPRYAALFPAIDVLGVQAGPLPIPPPPVSQGTRRWTLVLDTTVLTRATGDDQVMAGQLHHLLHLSERKSVDVRVVHQDSPLAPPLSTLSEYTLLDGTLWREESFTYSALATGDRRGRFLDEALKRAESPEVSRRMLAEARDGLMSRTGADRRC